MLKRTLLITCVGILLASQNVQAGDAAQAGAWGGAAGGAILGQAIGRNTKGTLLGTAIGGVLGYMIGNEADKGQGLPSPQYYPPPRVVQQRVIQQYEEIPPPPDCREVEVLAMVNGRPERVYSTACYRQGAWVLEDSGRVVSRTVIIDRGRYEPPRWGRGPGRDRDDYERERWHRARHFDRQRECDNARIIFR